MRVPIIIFLSLVIAISIGYGIFGVAGEVTSEARQEATEPRKLHFGVGGETNLAIETGYYPPGEIVIGQWGSSTQCDEGYGVLQVELQPELQERLESEFVFWGSSRVGKITIYCGRVVAP